MPPTLLDPSRLRDLVAIRQTEWLLTNARGGFASATVANLLTRRYHGLLVAAVKPPAERWVLLAKLEPTVLFAGQACELATNDYPGAVHPGGYQYLESFTPSPLPTWRWRLPGGALLEQVAFMPRGEDTIGVHWRLLEGPGSVELELRPLCTSRFFHELTERSDLGGADLDARSGGFTLRWPGRPTLHVDSNARFRPLPDWYYQFALATESDRGLDDRQDLYMPGPLLRVLERGEASGLFVAASAGPVSWEEVSRQREGVARSRTLVPLPERVTDPLARALARATGDFLVERGPGRPSVVAGYPWFADWGRDTFISLPGLCLVTGRHETARGIIETFAAHVDGGMIPNRFPDVGEQPEYNTADASLWYVRAIDQYLAGTGDWAFVAERMFPVIATILDAHEAGTRHGIGMDEDGLLRAGEPGLALTWMDASLDGRAFTPRIGKPVEINALWYNALRIAAACAERLGQRERATRWALLADRARQSFNQRFWNSREACCFDVVDRNHEAGSVDASIRPNQLFAVSLTYPVLDRARWSPLIRVVQERLLTPMGLRTLDPAHPDYKPQYVGRLAERDAAYHQGTVWPWLLGPFVTAFIRARGDAPSARAAARAMLSGLESHRSEAGLEGVSEVADAQPPHRPDGCPWQAWSVAEPLRALVEDVLGVAPPSSRSAAGDRGTQACSVVP